MESARGRQRDRATGPSTERRTGRARARGIGERDHGGSPSAGAEDQARDQASEMRSQVVALSTDPRRSGRAAAPVRTERHRTLVVGHSTIRCRNVSLQPSSARGSGLWGLVEEQAVGRGNAGSPARDGSSRHGFSTRRARGVVTGTETIRTVEARAVRWGARGMFSRTVRVRPGSRALGVVAIFRPWPGAACPCRAGDGPESQLVASRSR